MQLSGTIHTFSKPTKLFVLFFTLSLAFGYFAGYKFLFMNTGFTPAGIETNYNGNEDSEDAEEMKFKKSEREIMSIIHNHVLSLSVLFFALGLILLTTSLSNGWKAFLLVEPFVSLILTFGGIWLMWAEVTWFKYIVMVSGISITLTVASMVLIIVWQLYFRKK